MAISLLPLFTGTVPVLGQPSNVFNPAVQDLTNYETSLAPAFNVTIGEINDATAAITASETNAAQSAVDAQNAAEAAESSSNYVGPWSTLTGAYNLGITTSHSGKTWRLDVSLADITTSEPGVSGDYTDVTGVKADTDNTFTGINTFSAAVNEAGVTVTSTANSLVIDCSLGNKFTHVLTENTTLSFINPPANGVEYSFRLDIVQDAGASGFVLSLHSGVSWDNLTAPTLTSTANARDVLVFSTNDGFTTSDGFTPGQNMGVPV